MGERETALDFARRQVRQIDQKMEELVDERASILRFIEIAEKAQVQDTRLAEFAAKMPIGTPEPLSDRPGSKARQLNRQIVKLSMEIMREKGEPMSAQEIHSVHPLRERFTAEALYRLLYNRVVSRKLSTMSGAFWPIEQALPLGWETAEPTSKMVRPGSHR